MVTHSEVSGRPMLFFILLSDDLSLLSIHLVVLPLDLYPPQPSITCIITIPETVYHILYPQFVFCNNHCTYHH